MKIKSLQSGGQSPYYFTPYVSLLNDGTRSSLTYSEEEDKKKKVAAKKEGSGKKLTNLFDLVPSATLEALMKKGLPNDVDAAAKLIYAYTYSPKESSVLGGSLTTLGEDPELSVQKLNKNFVEVVTTTNKLIYNAEKYQEIENSLKENDAFGDIAMSTTGYAFGQDKDGKIVQVAPNEIVRRQQEGYRILTNSDMMHMRSREAKFAFDSTLFEQLDSNVSSKKILEFVNSSISSLGSDSTKQDSIEFNPKLQEQLKLAAEFLQQDPNMLFPELNTYTKYTVEQKSNLRQLQSTLNSLYAMMPTNYKNYLNAKAASVGMDSKNGALTILTGIMTGKQVNQQTVNIDPKFKDYNAELRRSTGTGGSGSTKMEHIPMTLQVIESPFNFNDSIKQMDEKGNVLFQREGSGYQNVLTRDGKDGVQITPIGMFDWAIGNSDLAVIGDINKTQVLGRKDGEVFTQIIPRRVLSKAVYNQTGFKIVDMPVDEVGNIEADNILNPAINRLYTQYNRNKAKYIQRAEDGTIQLTKDGETLQKGLQAAGLGLEIDTETGQLKETNTKKFIAIDLSLIAKDDKEVKDFIKNNDLIFEGSPLDPNKVLDVYNQQVTKSKVGEPQKEAVFDKLKEKDLYQCVVYIPLDEDNYQQALYGYYGLTPTVPEANFDRDRQATARAQQLHQQQLQQQQPTGVQVNVENAESTWS